MLEHSLSNFNVHIIHLESLLKCCFFIQWSKVRPEILLFLSQSWVVSQLLICCSLNSKVLEKIRMYLTDHNYYLKLVSEWIKHYEWSKLQIYFLVLDSCFEMGSLHLMQKPVNVCWKCLIFFRMGFKSFYKRSKHPSLLKNLSLSKYIS